MNPPSASAKMPPVRPRTVFEKLRRKKPKEKVRKPPPQPPPAESPISIQHSSNLSTTTEPDGLWESLHLDTGALSTLVSLGAATTAGVELTADSSGSGVPLRVRKANQDCFGVTPRFVGASDSLLAGVYDGHGAQGGEVSRLTKEVVPRVMGDAFMAHVARCGGMLRECLPAVEKRRAYLRLFTKSFTEAERALKDELHQINHLYSGTTATVVWLDGMELFVAWAGDSRAVLGRGEGAELTAVELTWDQKPARDDEKKRVRGAGARVTRWKKGVGPQRVWLPDEWLPGLAMTRSIGDTVLTEFGVLAGPEVSVTRLGAERCFVVAASDGVWEFMSSEEVVRLVERVRAEGGCAETAARELVNEAVRRWTENESVVDDTTAVVVYMDFAEEGKRGIGVAGGAVDVREFENRTIKDLFRAKRNDVDGLEKVGLPCLVGTNGRLEAFFPVHEDVVLDEGGGG